MNKPAPPLPASMRHGCALAILLATAALGACSSDTGTPESTNTTPHNVTLTEAQQQRIHLYTVASSSYQTMTNTTGVVDFDHNRSTDVLAPISGPVAKLTVTLGQTVQQGQVLALVDSPDFAAAVGTYRKALAAAKAADQLAATDRDLYAHQGVSQHEYAQAQSDAIGADSDRDAALQALVGLHVDPRTIADLQAGKPVTGSQGAIRAPIAGTVVVKSITPGQLLSAGTTDCFTIADTSKMWVMGQLFDSAFGAVKVGAPAEVETADGKSISGKVTNVGDVVDPNTRSVTARVAVDNPDGVLKQQMYVSVRIRSLDTQTGVLIPVSAVLRDDENLPFVYTVAADSSYARTPVTLGARIDDRYVIPQGLHAGDKVVVDGAIFLNFIQTQ
ncbi:efflux RND transporter periplasmic adaptor subunit [Rhodanobacter sp. DHG33]|uniref:efflux RND transporter periplasmic adaptor subunit n=1 Tax=Rhodanobacter sp. DHG33 TaxID=2775921 RepID=UPI00177D1290|nr:efflux RND transporter periplasmic adaptor subunit [Rhodanobacter sp. DHG33]MBD8898491.1 efflux RND transporter periplasmic adaptor subunit [Rhodanobacter sp. DHG33]